MSLFTRLDHVGIACHDLDQAVRLYRAAFDLEVCHRERNDDQGVVEAMIRLNGADDGGATYIQLLAPTRADSPVGKFLRTRGEGLHHVAFGCADVDRASAVLRARGVDVLFDPPRAASMGSRATFLHPHDCGGVLVEIVTAATIQSH
ncbi:methylmalonyl-CoA epimerase [Nocardia ignorata]|uniref:Methylmalonyl-CoA epimerase n=1 Tax=Nocardia ignorata TaxID=145285 RepID=A0A4R6PIW7_NOCIG|nr:methylmalonyl-CoA epimerase [Nocardia ignorata]TDP37676.1 methylmalonyl-CoA epimerase [Nocardia ignorata]